jgi:hypothetical protein
MTSSQDQAKLDLLQEHGITTPEQLALVLGVKPVKKTKTKRVASDENRCWGRIWNARKGARCKSKATCGEFCKTHNNPRNNHKCYELHCPASKRESKQHEFGWEHLGRYDQPPYPKLFTTDCWSGVFIENGGINLPETDHFTDGEKYHIDSLIIPPSPPSVSKFPTPPPSPRCMDRQRVIEEETKTYISDSDCDTDSECGEDIDTISHWLDE